VVRLRPLLEGVLADVAAGRTPAEVGSRLHATLAALVLDVCRRLRDETGLGVVALSGGVFQNRLLTDLCEDALEKAGFRVLTHALVPANDGGLSLGQAVVAGYNQLTEGGRRSLPAAQPTES
jgi:hydrogenase maturation protein HypF